MEVFECVFVQVELLGKGWISRQSHQIAVGIFCLST